ncbi:MAG: elongation factor P maturation arginine rhamnosyltransferase EarP, partial [Betaproteobacteria bacterium]|nr:elongation factor P maturation arginine rhamnosyltransferase EarP [Betaproteobacteria bacterium]
LEAFLALYAATLPSAVQSHISAFWQAWNSGGTSQAFQRAWPAYWQHRQIFADHAKHWAEHLESQTDLAAGLVQFCLNKL